MGSWTLWMALAVIQVVYSQRTFNPVNSRPAPGQSSTFVGPVFVRPSNAKTANNVFQEQPPPKPHYPIFGPVHVPTPGPFTQPPITAGHSSTIARVIQEAVGKVNSEDATMQRRLNSDHDRYGANFDNPDPLLFSESPENATAFSVQCRTINWIARLLKKNNMRESLGSVLAGPAAARHSIFCPFAPPAECPQYSRYRTVDGSCNNLAHALWGAAFTPFVRLLRPTYESNNERDDLPKSRSRHSGLLPPAREISTKFHEPSLTRSDDSRFSVLFTVFGQFVSHDVTDRAPTKGYQEAVLKCCNQEIPTPSGFCANIPIPQRDFLRHQFNRDCLEFPRSLEVTDVHCNTGTRQQLNQASAYIDGGAIYGATRAKSESLRSFKGGLLLVSVPNQLPISPPNNVHAVSRGFAFYAAGDNRVNEFIGLIGMETAWVREHNRIAKQLFILNPSWTDEYLYQETRRIIIAVLQHIVFREYLPTVLGKALMQKYNLHVLSGGRFSRYDKQADSGLANVFASVAMRFGHSMLPTTYSLLDRQNRRTGDADIDLKDTFFKPQLYLANENTLMRGFAQDPSKMCDRVFSGSIVNNLYETEVGNGADLAASNIQRSRDHGLPNYSDMRSYFSMPIPGKFDPSLLGFPDHNHDTVRRLANIYSDPRDVELFPGGISEKGIVDGAVGPVFGNIIGQQFKKIKEGDRFWYETEEKPQAFNDDQLGEIKKVTLARILCNTFGFDKIQKRALLVPHPVSNKVVPCGQIPGINLDYWQATGK